MPVTVDAIRAAREMLRGVARVTPVMPARYLAEQVGGPVWLKCENLQVAGSFKVR
ncbi:MAG: pyridoxal-phosphate dependent enzyme, partial [Actinomycetota bacterium]|nr:pyridoxal-phosphate dependent enzyme [Actinomycetota bacterium]